MVLSFIISFPKQFLKKPTIKNTKNEQGLKNISNLIFFSKITCNNSKLNYFKKMRRGYIRRVE